MQQLAVPLVVVDISSNDVVTCEGHNGSKGAKEMRSSSACILYAVSCTSGSYQRLFPRGFGPISPPHNALRKQHDVECPWHLKQQSSRQD